MIRITKLTDYGIVLMTHLAAIASGTPDEGEEHRYNAPDLALETGLPLPMVSKILKLLARDGLLVSHRGVKGGYALARRPAEISVDEIITALEGPVAITECIETSPSDCEHEPMCPTRTNWQRINQAVREALREISLAEMTHPIRQEKLVTLGRGSARVAAG
jgi:FeS assembly SUF system regulator